MKMTIVNDEIHQRITVLLDEEEVCCTDYDETGWAGLELVEYMAKNIARKAGWLIEEREENC